MAQRRYGRRAEVDDEQIAEVLGNWTGIPVFKLTEEETTRLLRMEDEAAQADHRPGGRRQGGLQGHPPHPRRSEGPQAPVGLVHLRRPVRRREDRALKALAEFLFGDDDASSRSTWASFTTASPPRGSSAPPGYVGYEEGGQLTEKVRRKAVLGGAVRRDREGAPGDLQHSAAGARDGRLTDGQGRTVDFKNTVLIFTSNLGTSDISKAVGLGFTRAAVTTTTSG